MGKMKKIIVCCTLLLVACMAKAQDLAGSWTGRLNVGNVSLTLVFNVAYDGDVAKWINEVAK